MLIIHRTTKGCKVLVNFGHHLLVLIGVKLFVHYTIELVDTGYAAVGKIDA